MEEGVSGGQINMSRFSNSMNYECSSVSSETIFFFFMASAGGHFPFKRTNEAACSDIKKIIARWHLMTRREQRV